MNHIRGALIAIAALGVTQPALADVKAGVDAWQQGDYAKAVSEWRPFAQAGDPDAQFNMGQAYKLGRGAPTDMKAAIDWYRKAAAQGHQRAEDNLGLLLFQQGDRDAAMPYLERAADRGDSRAQYIVATALFNGDIVKKDWVRAYALMTRASSAGLAQANTSLQQMDKYIPDDQRKKGIELAARLEQQGKGVSLAATEPKPGNSVRPVPSTARAERTPTPLAAATPPKAKEAAPPKPAPAKTAETKPPAPAAPVKTGPWRVQLGAFSEEARARLLWTRLTSRVRGLSSYQPYIATVNKITRLQTGPFASAADATRLCGQIKAAGADCIPRKQ